MDIDPFKILAAIGTFFAIGDKLHTYVRNRREKASREGRKQLKKCVNRTKVGSKKTYSVGLKPFLIPQGDNPHYFLPRGI
jgi:hypothetical protein